jgi:hypothetical protein
MPTTALLAHYDGHQICLDEPFDLTPNTKLLVTVLPEKAADKIREEWLRLSAQRLEAAYGENEPEYTAELIREENPDYEGR